MIRSAFSGDVKPRSYRLAGLLPAVRPDRKPPVGTAQRLGRIVDTLWSEDGGRRWAIIDANGWVRGWVWMHEAMRLRQTDPRVSVVHVPAEMEGVLVRRRGVLRRLWYVADGALRERQDRLERDYLDSLEGAAY